MRIRDLLKAGPPATTELPASLADPLRDRDALSEAQLLAIHLDVLTSTGGLLFDFRQGGPAQKGNVGLMALHGVQRFDWKGPPQGRECTAWNVDASHWTQHRTQHRNHFTLELAFFPDASLSVTVEGAHFYAGFVPDIPDAPPNFASDSDEVIHAGTPNWDSVFIPTEYGSLDAFGNQ